MKYVVELNGQRKTVALESDGVGYEGEQAARAELSDIEGSPVRMVKIGTRVFRVVTEKKQGRGRYSLWVDGYRFEVEALAFPVWTYPPVVNGDRGQSPQGPLTFIGSATQWPVIVVPIGFVGEQLPIGMQLLGQPWSEPRLIEMAYAFEQLTQHRRPPRL